MHYPPLSQPLDLHDLRIPPPRSEAYGHATRPDQQGHEPIVSTFTSVPTNHSCSCHCTCAASSAF